MSALTEMWGYLIAGFCKVQFLCYNGEPNWLGWAVIVLSGIFILALFLALLTALFET